MPRPYNPRLDLELPDGAPIEMPVHSPHTQDSSLLFQRELIRDMCTGGKYCTSTTHGPGMVSGPDPWNPEKILTRGDLFDQHARLLLVIQEVEARAEGAKHGT